MKLAELFGNEIDVFGEIFNEASAEEQAARFKAIADNLESKENIFLNSKAVIAIVGYLLKQEKINTEQAEKLKKARNLDQFKEMLKKMGISMTWDGDMKVKPTFEYPKTGMVDGSSLSNGGKYKSW